jgi:hypothetical protein
MWARLSEAGQLGHDVYQVRRTRLGRSTAGGGAPGQAEPLVVPAHGSNLITTPTAKRACYDSGAKRSPEVSFEWIHEDAPRWDDPKDAIVGGATEGVFDLGNYREGDVIPGEWWRVEEGGKVLGYGWMDATWGEAEILLAVDPAQQKRGVGGFILTRVRAIAR